MIESNVKSQQWKYVLLFLIAIVLIILFILIITPPATGYELSLHDVYPPYFWLLTAILALAPLIYLVITYKFPQYFSWKSICILVTGTILNRLLYSYLPLIRGYFSYSGFDLFTHLAKIAAILETGSMGTNHYPYVHVAIAEIVEVVGCSREMAVYHFEAFSTLVFLLLLIPVCRHFLKNQKYTVLAITLLALPVSKTEFIMPSYWVYYFLVFYLYIIYRAICNDKNHQYLILSLLFSVLGWFIHPEFVLYSALFIVIIGISTIIHSKISLQKVDNIWKCINVQNIFVILIILLIGFIYIFSNTPAFSVQVTLFDNIFSGFGGSDESTFSDLKRTTLGFIEIMVFVITKYGVYIFIPASTVLITLSYICHTGFRNISLFNQTLILLLVGFSIFALANMVVGTVIGIHPTRMLKYVYLISTLMLAAYGIQHLFSIPRNIIKKLLMVLLIITILSTYSLAIAIAYGNPELNSSNTPITKQERDGMETFLNVRSDYYLIEELSSRAFQDRYYYLIYGYNSNVSRTNIRSHSDWSEDNEYDYRSHLGYSVEEYTGNRYDEKHYQLLYLPIGAYTRLFSNNTLYHGGISIDDLNHIMYDISAIKTQDNGQFQVYLMQPTKL